MKTTDIPPSNYVLKVMAWGQQAFAQAPYIRPDAEYYRNRQLTPSQRTDLGLLLTTLASTDASRIHLRCDEWCQSDDLFGLIIATLCFYKHAQNHRAIPFDELYKSGTVLYHPAKERARVVIGRNETGLYTRPVKEDAVRQGGVRYVQEEDSNPTFQQVADYIPLANVLEHSYTRNALGNLKEYFDLFRKNTRNHRALTRYPRRLLVVAPYSSVQQLPLRIQFPIRYGFERHYTVPVVEPLIEIVNRYSDARSQLREDSTIDEVVVLGDLGYRESLNNLINDLEDGYFKRLTIVGGQALPAHSGFRCWPWSRSERSIIRTGQQNHLKRILLPSEKVKSLRPLFLPAAQQLMELGLPEAQAHGSINRLIAHHLRDALIDGPALLAYQANLLNEPDSVYRAWFAETGHLSSYPAFCESLIKGLQVVSEWVTQNPAKLSKVEELAGQYAVGGGHTWVVVRPKQTEALNEYFNKDERIKAISHQKLKELLNSPRPSDPEQFIFPSLHLNYEPGGNLLRDYCLYRRAVERGPGYVLAYEGLEDGMANLCEWLYQRDDHRCLAHADRKHWVDFSYDLAQPLPLVSVATGLVTPAEAAEFEDMLDELDAAADDRESQSSRTVGVLLKLNESFNRYFGIWRDVKRSLRNQQPDKTELEPETGGMINANREEVKRRFLIRFDDKTEYDCKGETWLAKVQGGQVIEVKPSQVQKGDRIVYFSISLDTCYEALRSIPQAQPALKEVKWASRAWREWLRNSVEITRRSKNCTEGQARQLRYGKLLEHIRVEDPADNFIQLPRFEYWLDKHEDNLFPRTIRHLEIILESHLNQIIPAKRVAKQAEMEQILAARDQSASFREVITSLNHELTHHVLSGQKGDLLTNMAEKFVQDLLKTRKDRRVHSIDPV